MKSKTALARYAMRKGFSLVEADEHFTRLKRRHKKAKTRALSR